MMSDMQGITRHKDGSVTLTKAFFDAFLHPNDMMDLTLVIEKRAGQIACLGCKIKRPDGFVK